MAGGMTHGSGETIAKRVASTRAVAERTAAELPPPSEDTAPDLRHCWYDGPHGRQAALLIEWRKRAGLWSARIATAQRDDAGWILAEMWVEGDMIAPVEIS